MSCPRGAKVPRLTALLALAPTVLLSASTARPLPRSRVLSRPLPRLEAAYGNRPLSFEPNLGQTDPRVRFLTRGAGATTFLTDTGAVMVLARNGARDAEQAVVRMRLIHARMPRFAAGLEKLPGIGNYFIGNDPKKWRTGIPNYAKVAFQGVYPGVNLVYRGNQRRLEYDFVVAPGANPALIELAYDGVDSVDVDPDGDLLLATGLGTLRQHKPVIYQETAGRRVEVAGGYEIRGRRVGFALAGYDASRPLVIDPMVEYSTYLGGSGDDYP